MREGCPSRRGRCWWRAARVGGGARRKDEEANSKTEETSTGARCVQRKASDWSVAGGGVGGGEKRP
eukprot:1136526-Pelagomonas_calceolata.AAC.4